VLCFGRLDRKKGIDVLTQASAVCRPLDRDARLVIAGSGAPEYEADLRELVQRSGIAARVDCLGFVPADGRADTFADSHRFALPSHYENFDVAVVEGMHGRLPVLISRRVFLAGDGARITPDSFATIRRGRSRLSTKRVCQNAEARGEVATCGREFARGPSPESLRARYERLLESLVKQARTGAEIPL
jgi:glycosyltransferase involved in cell wall biosynthesis